MTINEKIISGIAKHLLGRRCIAFIGAGFSELAGGPSSHDLRKEFASLIGIPDEQWRTLPLSVIAQYVVNSAASYARGRQMIAKILEQRLQSLRPSKEHLMLPKLCFQAIYTTNYDCLIEDSYAEHIRQFGPSSTLIQSHPSVADGVIEPSVVSRNSHILKNSDGIRIIKLHGCITSLYDHCRRWDSVPFVITLDDYAMCEKDRELLFTLLTSQLCEYHFLFMGYSLRDESFQSVYKHVARFLNERQPQSYAIIRAMDQFERQGWEQIGLQPIETHDLCGFLRDLRRAIRQQNHMQLSPRTSILHNFVKNYLPSAADVAYFALAERFSRARWFYDAGNYAKAKKILGNCIRNYSSQLSELPIIQIAITRAFCSIYRKLNEFDKAFKETKVYEQQCGQFEGLLSTKYLSDCLQIRGMILRQLSSYNEAKDCLQQCIELKMKLVDLFDDELLFIADCLIVWAEIILDQLSSESDPNTGYALVENARSLCEDAYARYDDAIGNAEVHYKGRYYGTMAMLLVRTSLLGDQIDWEAAFSYATKSFSPQETRKPYGIIAGTYNLGVVELAFAESGSCKNPSEMVRCSTEHLKKCLYQTDVQLGKQYEIPKILKALKLSLTREQHNIDEYAARLAMICSESGIKEEEINIFSPLT